MKKTTKMLLTTLSLSFALSLGLGVSAMQADASASPITMVDGASVRLVTNENGLRFCATMSTANYNEYEAKGGEYGMLIMPYDYIAKYGDLSEANVFGENAVYDWANYDQSTGDFTYTGTKTRIINLRYETMVSGTEYGDYAVMGSITNLKDANLEREFVGRAYIRYTETGSEGYRYVMADYAAGDVTNNARTIVEVADSAIASGKHDNDDDALTVLNGYKNTAYDLSWAKGTNSTGSIPATSTENLATGSKYSLHFMPSGTWNSMFLNNSNLNWQTDEVKSMTFEIYNPSAEIVYINVGTGDGESGGYICNNPTKLEVKEGRNTFTVDVSAYSNGEYIYFASGHNADGNQGDTSTQWDNYTTNGVYIDNFTFTYWEEGEKEAVAQDLAWAQARATSTATLSSVTDSTYLAQGSQYALWYQPTGTWNGFYMSNSNLNWQTDSVKNVTFKVYNPSSHTVYAWASHGDGTASVYSGTIMELATGWNTVVLGTNEFADGEYLTFASHYGNVGTGNNGASDSAQFKEHQEKGLYFDDFVITYFQEGEKEDMDWAEGTVSTGATTAISEENLATGSKYSLHFMSSGNWNSIFLNNSNLNWNTDGITSISFEVYNPSNYTIYVNAATGNGTAGGGYVANNPTLLTVESGWNEFTVDTSAFADGVYLYFATGVGNYGNGDADSDGWKAWQANGLYLDNFVVNK